MFSPRRLKIIVDFMKKPSFLLSSLAVLMCLPQGQHVDGLSVPGLCMLEQRRLLNITDHVKKRQEDQIIDTIETICRGYIDYITCFTTNLPNSHEVGDRFSRLMYHPRSMFVAYRGLCTKDLAALRQIKACLVVTPELTACYKKYEKGVRKVIQLQDQGAFTTGDLQRLACNVSVGRYKCEIEAYSDCSAKAGQIMQDYIYASLSDKCRNRMGLTSRYTLPPRKNVEKDDDDDEDDDDGDADNDDADDEEENDGNDRVNVDDNGDVGVVDEGNDDADDDDEEEEDDDEDGNNDYDNRDGGVDIEVGYDASASWGQRSPGNSASTPYFGVVNRLIKICMEFILDTVAFSVEHYKS